MANDETQNMRLEKPVIGVNGDTFEQASQKGNNNLDKLDSHDHSLGKGTAVPSSGININDDLSFNGHGILDNKNMSFKDITDINDITSIANGSIFLYLGNLSFKTSSGNIATLLDASRVDVVSNPITDIRIEQVGTSIFRFVIVLAGGEEILTDDFSFNISSISTVLRDIGVPSSDAGENGELYFDTSAENLYIKIAENWIAVSTDGGGGDGGGLTEAQVNTLINNSGHASQTDLSTEVTDRALGDEDLGIRVTTLENADSGGGGGLDSGNTFPDTASLSAGYLFVIKEVDGDDGIGLYCWDGTDWNLIAGVESGFTPEEAQSFLQTESGDFLQTESGEYLSLT